MPTSADQPEPTQLSMPIGKVLTGRRPDEISTPITKEEFLTLCEGETSSTKHKLEYCRDLCIASLIALISLLASTDWGAFDKRQDKWIFFLFATVFVAAAAGFGAAWIVFRYWIGGKDKSSHYLRMKVKLESDFAAIEKIAAASGASAGGDQLDQGLAGIRLPPRN